MKKRVLSLVLALVMLVLAVPVFALPTFAVAADPILNFYLGPTDSSGQNTAGTWVSSTTLSKGALPTDAQLAAAGSLLTGEISFYIGPFASTGSASMGTPVKTYGDLSSAQLPTDAEVAAAVDQIAFGTYGGLSKATLPGIIGWYWWDAAAEAFVEAETYLAECLAGNREPAAHAYFYPIFKDSTTVPWYADWIDGENQPIILDGQLLAYTGGWSYGLWDDTGYRTLNTVNGNYLEAAGNTANHVNIGINGGFLSTSSTATVLTYQAPASGKVTVRLPHTYNTLELAVAHNDALVWPNHDADPNTDGIQRIPASNATALANKAFQQANTAYVVDRVIRYDNAPYVFELDVAAGDRIHFMMYKESSSAWWYPQVSYSVLTGLPPTVDAGVSVSDSLAINTRVNVPEGVAFTESGLLVDGEKLGGSSIPVAAKDADTVYRIRPYYIADGVTYYGRETTVSVTGLLMSYAQSGDDELMTAASAALAYTAAAKAYFAGEPVSSEFVPSLDYSARAEDSYLKAATYTGADKIGFSGVSLLLNDRVNIKVVALTADARYALEVADNAAFSGAVTISREATDGGRASKFIMDGISVLNWNTDYYFRIVDTASGNRVVSDTLRYGVSVYYARMAADPAADAGIKNLTATMMYFLENINGTYKGSDKRPAAEVAEMFASGSFSDGANVAVKDGLTVALTGLGGTVRGGGALISSPEGFVFRNCKDLTLTNMTLRGAVQFLGCENVTLENVTILASGTTAVNIDAASSEIYFRGVRVEGDLANGADGFYFLDSELVGDLRDYSAKDLYVCDSRIAGTLLTASDNAEIRGTTVTADAADTAAIEIGEAKNVLVATCTLSGGSYSLLMTGADNAVAVRNTLASVRTNNGRHIYVCDNSFTGKLYAYDNNYMLADGNDFPSGYGYQNAVQSGNQNTNGDTLMDVDARLAAGADDRLLPHVDRDQFFGEERKTVVRDPDGDMLLDEYVKKHARAGEYVIIAPGAYVAYRNLAFGAAESNTTVYAYGMFAERPATGALDHGGDPLHGLVTVGDYYNPADGSENLTIKGGTYGYEYQGHAQAHVIEKLDGNRLLLKAAAGYVDDFGLSNTDLFISTSYGYRADRPYNYADTTHSNAEKQADGTVILTVSSSTWSMARVGDVYTARPAHGTAAVHTDYSKNITYQDMTIFASMGGVCFHEYYNESSINYFRVADAYRAGFEITKEEYDAYKALEAQYGITTEVYYDSEHGCYRGPAARNASLDGVHVVSSAGGAQIISSLFERVGDDGTNQLASFSRLSAIERIDDETLEIVYKGNLSPYWNRQNVNATCYWAHTHTQPFAVGDQMLIYTPNGGLVLDGTAVSATQSAYEVTNDFWGHPDNTWDEKGDDTSQYERIATYRVRVKITSYDEKVLADYLPYLDPYSAENGVLISSGDGKDPNAEGKIYINGPDEKYKVFVHNNDMASKGVHIDNTKVTCGRARAALIKTSDVLIENVTYEHIGMAAIGVYYEEQWNESSVSRNVTIRNSVIDHTGYRTNHIDPAPIAVHAPSTPAPGKDNTNADLDKISLYSDVTITGNIIKNRAIRKEYHYDADEYAISCSGVRNLVITNNDLGTIRDMAGDPDLLEDEGLFAALTKTIKLERINGCRIEGNLYPSDVTSVKSSFTFSQIQGLTGADVENGNMFPAFR